jgi:hypothetical protein
MMMNEIQCTVQHCIARGVLNSKEASMRRCVGWELIPVWRRTGWRWVSSK